MTVEKLFVTLLEQVVICNMEQNLLKFHYYPYMECNIYHSRARASWKDQWLRIVFYDEKKKKETNLDGLNG